MLDGSPIFIASYRFCIILGNFLASSHEDLIVAYLEEYISRSDGIDPVDIKERATLCTDLVGNLHL